MGAAGAADIPADLREAIPPQLNAGQKAIVALKVRELLQPMAKERQREAGGDHGNQFTGGKLALPANLREPPTPQLSAGQKPRAADIPADLREGGQPQLNAGQKAADCPLGLGAAAG